MHSKPPLPPHRRQFLHSPIDAIEPNPVQPRTIFQANVLMSLRNRFALTVSSSH